MIVESGVLPEKYVVALKFPSMAAFPVAMFPALMTDWSVAAVPPVTATFMVVVVMEYLDRYTRYVIGTPFLVTETES